MQSFPSTETTFLLPGPAGNLELIATPPGETKRNAIAIICHPHPLFGGTMNNKVVSTLARSFKDLGLPTVRFNFRGVGKSEGKFDEGMGEVEDLLAVVKWVQKVSPETELWLAGFSFGGFIAASVAVQIPISQLVTVAPQVSRFTSISFPPITCPWILVQGDEDEIVSPEEVYAWVETLNPKPKLIRLPGADHFFHGQLLVLRQKLTDALF